MITITEALAEIATIDKRLLKKLENMRPYVARLEQLRDPFEKTGGSAKYLVEESQSMRDLLQRKIDLRAAISASNSSSSLTIEGTERSIADWLVWKREVYPKHRDLLNVLVSTARGARDQAQRQGVAVVALGEKASKPDDVIINVDEQQMIKDLETLEELHGKLDGLLSLKNATTTIDV